MSDSRDRDLEHEIEIRKLIDEYEGKLVSAKLHELEALAQEHRISHQREHEYTEVAIAKATESLDTRLNSIATEAERTTAEHQGFMTADRFEREHAVLVEKRQEDHEILTRLVTQLATLRGLLIFLGLPGLAALGWIVLGALTHQTVTGPNGVVP